MTDRIHALTVVLDRDYRDDDVVDIVLAIKMIKGVASVEEHVAQVEDYYARARVAAKVQTDIYRAVKGVFDNLKLD